MSWSLKLFEVRGIEIRVHATFVLILIWAAYYWNSRADEGAQGALFGVVATILLFGCVLLHELGHSFQALRFGIPVRDITLLPIGGLARMERIPEKPEQELRIAIAGPLVNVVIAAVLIVVAAVLNATGLVEPSDLTDAMRSAEWEDMIAYLIWANLALAVFNIIPAFPMDGGRVLRALLAMRMSYPRATEIAVAVGQAVAFALGLIGFATGDFFLIIIAVFVWMGAGQEGQQVAVTSVLGRATVDDAMIRRPQTLSSNDPLSRAIELTLNTAQADFPVIDDAGRVVGLLTAEDILKNLRDQPGAIVGQVMRADFPTAAPGVLLTAAQEQMANGRVRALPVVTADRQLVGMITAIDIGEAYRFLAIRPRIAAMRPAGGAPPGGVG